MRRAAGWGRPLNLCRRELGVAETAQAGEAVVVAFDSVPLDGGGFAHGVRVSGAAVDQQRSFDGMLPDGRAVWGGSGGLGCGH